MFEQALFNQVPGCCISNNIDHYRNRSIYWTFSICSGYNTWSYKCDCRWRLSPILFLSRWEPLPTLSRPISCGWKLCLVGMGNVAPAWLQLAKQLGKCRRLDRRCRTLRTSIGHDSTCRLIGCLSGSRWRVGFWHCWPRGFCHRGKSW